MASGGPIMNGDVSRSPSSVATLDETLVQMNILIQENRNLKETLRKTNLMMKERFEGLSSWREKQQGKRDLLETRLEKAQVQLEALSVENQEMSKKLAESSMSSSALDVLPVEAAVHRGEVNTLHALVSRLQAEKNDLVALNSELQLKTDQNSREDSFVEVITVSDNGLISMKGGGESGKRPDAGMTASHLDSEEVTVSHLLLSLKNETMRAERLQAELQATIDKIRTMEERRNHHVTVTTQTSMTENTRNDCEKDQVASEFITSQVRMLFKELEQAQSKLDDAERMKKNLQERCREVEKDVAALKAQLADKQAVKTENEQLKLRLESMHAQSLIVQKKAGEERSNLAQLKDAYTKLFEDYNELKEEEQRREAQLVNKEVVDDLQSQLNAAEKALTAKQERIDSLKQEMFMKEKELETISVLQAQAEVYSSDFYAERAAREKLHEERERLAIQLEYVKKRNNHLQEEMDSMSRQNLSEMQRRHLGNSNAQGGTLVARGTDWQHQGNIPEHVCPKCNEILPDLDSLQIHIMDCIN
ncbi:LOW QUALITY PROTEIN: optineurin [Phycodurus eques]|uniref:LOW QUALITY PROTEIN: optineurin n=1 Tax=Phycodurus eques TaxID=693459 RepID=UPI002ACDA60D|nr:LOW QUALITY PROTEIN: optineurin [Phycodurus eques]